MREAVLVLTLVTAGTAVAAAPSEELSAAELQWLDDVEWILSPIEREVFLRLSAAKRGGFIQAFWAARDPVPSTSENEFFTEHVRRVRHADERLAAGSARRGSKTDQGWAYIVLGPPRQIQRFSGRRQLYPLEVWHYSGQGRRGLPSLFHLVFFQPLGVGEWRLYNPVLDGPASLVPAGVNRSVRNSEAIGILRKIDEELARASLTIDAGGPHDLDRGTADPGAGADLERLRAVAARFAPDGYARSWAAGGAGRVSAAASFEPYELRVAAQLMAASDGGLFLHSVVELPPEQVVLEAVEARYHLGLELTTVILDRHGQELEQRVQRAEAALDAAGLERIRTSPLCVSGVLAAAPSAARVRYVVRQPAGTAIGRAEIELAQEVHEADSIAREKLCPWQVSFEHEPLDAPQHRLERAEQLERAGQAALAVPELRRALAARPEPRDAALRLGALLVELKRPREAVDLLEPRVAGLLATVGPLEATQIEELALCASAHVLRTQYVRAAELYARALDAAPESTRLLNALAATEQARGRPQRAAELFRRSLRVDPDQPRIRSLLQRLELHSGGGSP
jgi:GWxTD domain-containing protein